jgi:hypothetical protein
VPAQYEVTPLPDPGRGLGVGLIARLGRMLVPRRYALTLTATFSRWWEREAQFARGAPGAVHLHASRVTHHAW